MPLSDAVLVIVALLSVAMLAAGAGRRLPVPYTVVLVLVGVALGEGARQWAPLAPLGAFRLQPEVVFFVFLPALIFESGFNLDARQLVRDLVPVLVLAVPALLVSTVIVGLGLAWVLDLPPMIGLLFGALISATDPVAVVALFKELGAPPRLTVLVEGESLLNDATAIVVFGILLAMAGGGHDLDWAGLAGAIGEFLEVFVGGAVVGLVAGLAIGEITRWVRTGTASVLVMSLVMAWASFVVAEHHLHVSGVMAAAAAAVTLAMWGVTRVPGEDTAAVRETWELIALICNSLLFLLVGLSVDPTALASRAGAVLSAVGLVLLARAATVYTLVPATTRLFALPAVSIGERHIMWWGGLKGGLAIAIALSIPESLPERGLLLDLTLGVVLFTLVVNAPTIRPLMARLGLDRMSAEERTEMEEGVRGARGSAERWVGALREAGVVSAAQARGLEGVVRDALPAPETALDPARLAYHLHLEALRAESECLAELHAVGVVSQYTFLEMRGILEKDRERTAPVGEGSPESLFLRAEQALLRRLREHDWAGPVLTRYQNARLGQNLRRTIAGILTAKAALAMLESRDDLEPDVREGVAGAYRDRLERRQARLEALIAEFPGLGREFATSLTLRAALRGAAHEAVARFHEGRLVAKAHAAIGARIAAALARVPQAPARAAGPDPRALVSRLPLFAGLDAAALDSLAAHAVAVNFLDGDTVIAEGNRGDALYIVMRGRVSVSRLDSVGGELRLGTLGQGDFFGETALLGDHVRTATVRAMGPAALLRVSRRDVLHVAAAHAEIGASLERALAERAERATPDDLRAM